MVLYSKDGFKIERNWGISIGKGFNISKLILILESFYFAYFEINVVLPYKIERIELTVYNITWDNIIMRGQYEIKRY